MVDEEQLAVNTGNAGTLLLKLHGDLRHPARLVVSEADYDGFLAKYPLLATYLSNQLITKTAIFVGYSLDDPDFRQLWHIVSERLGRSRRLAYTIAVGARAADIARFERRGIKVINLPGSREKYDEILAQVFRELREYIRDNVISVSKVTEERPLRELLLPRNTSTTLCFFSLTLELLPFYRERIFPAVEDAGFVPVTADDVVSPGDNISAKLDALIDRSAVMIAELNSSWTIAEFRMAIARIKGDRGDSSQRKPLRLIVVIPEGDQVPAIAYEWPIIRRPARIADVGEEFVQKLIASLQDIDADVGAGRGVEPQRLLAAREYRAAVISALSLLETSLRTRLNKVQWPQTTRPLALRSLVGLAIAQEVINERMRPRLDSWVKTRNEVVHSAIAVSKAQATEIVDGVTALLREL